MKSGAKAMSKLSFWFENVFYILFFFIYELLLCPLIFAKVFVNIVRMCEFKNIVYLILFWTFFGLIYLVFAVFKDMFYFVKILCNS